MNEPVYSGGDEEFNKFFNVHDGLIEMLNREIGDAMPDLEFFPGIRQPVTEAGFKNLRTVIVPRLLFKLHAEWVDSGRPTFDDPDGVLTVLMESFESFGHKWNDAMLRLLTARHSMK